MNMITFLSTNGSVPSTHSHLLTMQGLPKVETVEPEQPSLGEEGTCIIDVTTILDEEVPALPDLNRLSDLQDNEDLSS